MRTVRIMCVANQVYQVDAEKAESSPTLTSSRRGHQHTEDVVDGTRQAITRIVKACALAYGKSERSSKRRWVKLTCTF